MHVPARTPASPPRGLPPWASPPWPQLRWLRPHRPTRSRPCRHDVRLTAAEVPPGGLITSFLGNQVIYCSLVCPGLVQTGVTPVVTTLQAPGVFVTALQSGDLLKAIGATAASVTGPTNAAAAAAIVADGTLVAPRALNAFETLVVGLLNVVPAATGGLPGIATAIQAARQDTFTAQNLPIVANPTPTVMPQGVVEVAAVGALNVGGAIIFNGFNDILFGAFATPNAVAQELGGDRRSGTSGRRGCHRRGRCSDRRGHRRRGVGRHRGQQRPRGRRAISSRERDDADPKFLYRNNIGSDQGGSFSPVGHDAQTRRHRAR